MASHPLLSKLGGLRKKAGESPPVGANDWNTLLDVVRAIAPASPADGLVSWRGAGTFVAGGKGGMGIATAIHPWQPYDIQERKFRLRPGTVTAPNGTSLVPSNQNFQFEAPESTDTGFIVWLRATLVNPNNPSITSLQYQTGTDIPASGQAEPGNPGSIPPFLIIPLLAVTSHEGRIDEVFQYRDRSLQIRLVVNNLECGRQTRSLSIADA
jgi:hypothetical protein